MTSQARAEPEADLWRVWRDAAAHPAVDEAIRDLYTELDAQVTARGPTCWTSGRCCKFDTYGHRLYVTGLEIAWFLRQVSNAGSPIVGSPLREEPGVTLPQLGSQLPDACPYQIDGLCSTHAVRPLGCRVFFCQQGTEVWQQELYERFLGELRRLHEARDLPYRYMEWRAGLAEHALTCVSGSLDAH